MLNAFYTTIQNQARDNKLFAEIQDESLSYRDLLSHIEKTVSFLRSHSLQDDSRVIIATKHDRSFLILTLSCLLEGISSILLAPDTKIDKLIHFVKLTDPKLIFVDEENLERCQEAINCPIIAINSIKPKQAFIKKILGTAATPKSTYPELLQGFSATPPHCQSHSDDIALIVFTSGSTSAPKGVMLSYQNIFSHLQTFKKVFSYHEQSILFNNLPLYHMDGLIQGPMITLFCGATLIRPEKFSLHNLDYLFNKVAAKKVSHIILVPSILVLLDRYTMHDDYFTAPTFQYILSTAAYLNPDLWAKLQKRFQTTICNIYGLVETVAGGLFCGPDPTRFAIGTVGAPVDMQIKIINETAEEQPNNQVGELLLRGENISRGYIGQPNNNSPTFKDGWLYTGDLARRNPQGLIEIVGRKKEVIVSNGVTIYPEEINEVLLKHSQVNDVASFGMADDLWGEILIVAIETSQTLDQSDLLNFCHQYLEAEKIPKRFIFISEMPRGPAGKPLLATLKGLAQQNFTSELSNIKGLTEIDIITLAAEVFKVSTTNLSIHSAPHNFIGWDSLGHIRLIEAAERRFQIRYRMSDIMKIASLSDLYEHTKHLLEYAN